MDNYSIFILMQSYKSFKKLNYLIKTTLAYNLFSLYVLKNKGEWFKTL